MHLQSAFLAAVPCGSQPRSAAAQGPCRPGDILHPHPAGPHQPTPDAALDVLTATASVKRSEHSLWCGGCSFCPDSQTSSPVVRLRRRPRWKQTGRITAGRRIVVRMMVMKMAKKKTRRSRVIYRRPQTWRIKLSLNSGSWQPPGLRRCTKPFLPRRSQTRGEGGTAREPLPNKRTARSMRRASPCSIDSREALMPSIALAGLGKAGRECSLQTSTEGTNEETASSHLTSHYLLWLKVGVLFERGRAQAGWHDFTCLPALMNLHSSW